jgi:hypothetical protein
MSYLTLQVEIDHGRIVPREPERLPEKGNGLLTILSADNSPPGSPRPFGLAQGQFRVPPDFNRPLPEEVLRDFEGA